MAERQGIEIDYCPKCRGVWLDRGELDKLIERSASVQEPPSREVSHRSSREAARPERYEDEHYHRRKRKRGFLGDIFDFD